MTPLSQLTRRNYLIAAHDALALLASFYLRFQEGEAFYARLPLLLLKILPFFVVFMLRLQSDDHEMAFHCCRSWHLPGTIRPRAC